ncbi:uncharacterized protein LOC105166567 [Sesamum indicum]|uniref:Uncharacterized protein LOC105166567 n=1 Tax=Sesamum indicum TaxID=4182 RepID=A0A6I9TM14_SESIN|nr:uncharacterized protein LOC105166567 [Sesamum indicum]
MGCFTACFDPKKHKKLMKKLPNQSLSPRDELLHEALEISAAGTESQKEEGIVNSTKPVLESEAKNEEQMNGSKGKESVNSNLDTADTDNSVENEKGKAESILGKDHNGGSGSNSYIVRPHHGHQDLSMSKEECVAVNSIDLTLENTSREGGTDDHRCVIQPESSESLFSLSIDSRKQVSASEMGADKEVSSPLKPSDRENNKKSLRFTVFRYSEDKENVNTLEEKWIIPSKDQTSLHKSKTRCDDLLLKPNEIPMDTSLSSWLVGSEKSAWAKTSSISSPGSEKNYGERPVLGVITSTKDVKQLVESTSGGSTPCHSADDQPGVGTVGRYWQQTSVAGGGMLAIETKM